MGVFFSFLFVREYQISLSTLLHINSWNFPGETIKMPTFCGSSTKHTHERVLHVPWYDVFCLYATHFNLIPNFFFQLIISFQVTQNDITIDIIKPESFPFLYLDYLLIISSHWITPFSRMLADILLCMFALISKFIRIQHQHRLTQKAPTLLFFFSSAHNPTCFLPDAAEIKTRHLSTRFW